MDVALNWYTQYGNVPDIELVLSLVEAHVSAELAKVAPSWVEILPLGVHHATPGWVTKEEIWVKLSLQDSRF